MVERWWYIHMHMSSVCEYTDACMCIHICRIVYMYAHVWVCVDICTCMYVYTYMCMYVYLHVCMQYCMHPYMYACIQSHTHTHPQTTARTYGQRDQIYKYQVYTPTHTSTNTQTLTRRRLLVRVGTGGGSGMDAAGTHSQKKKSTLSGFYTLNVLGQWVSRISGLSVLFSMYFFFFEKVGQRVSRLRRIGLGMRTDQTYQCS